jgi:hypothetical protein
VLRTPIVCSFYNTLFTLAALASAAVTSFELERRDQSSAKKPDTG